MKKSKWDILGKEIDKDIDSEYDSWFYWWYDGGDYFDHDYGLYYTYEYSEPVYREYFSKRGKWGKDRQLVGNYIDMMSVYDIQTLRQKKINFLLGVNNWEIAKKPTLKDIKINKYSDEN